MPEKQLVPFTVLVPNSDTSALATLAAETLGFGEGFYVNTGVGSRSRMRISRVYRHGPAALGKLESFLASNRPDITVKNTEPDIYEINVDERIKKPEVLTLRNFFRDSFGE